MAGTMSLMDAPEYDPARGPRIRRRLYAGLAAALVVAAAVYSLWDWPQQRILNHFFALVEQGNYPAAYAAWNHDPEWRQHLSLYTGYTYSDFLKDWGPRGDYGVIRSHHITMTKTVGNGVVMGVDINGGTKPLFMRVDLAGKTVGYSPVELYEGR